MCTILTVLIQYVTIRQTVYTQHLIIVFQKATCFGCTRHLALSITLKMCCVWRVCLIVMSPFVSQCMQLSSVRTFTKYLSFATSPTALLAVFMCNSRPASSWRDINIRVSSFSQDLLMDPHPKQWPIKMFYLPCCYLISPHKLKSPAYSRIWRASLSSSLFRFTWAFLTTSCFQSFNRTNSKARG
jgi:hypothetical protein